MSASDGFARLEDAAMLLARARRRYVAARRRRGWSASADRSRGDPAARRQPRAALPHRSAVRLLPSEPAVGARPAVHRERRGRRGARDCRRDRSRTRAVRQPIGSGTRASRSPARRVRSAADCRTNIAQPTRHCAAFARQRAAVGAERTGHRDGAGVPPTPSRHGSRPDERRRVQTWFARRRGARRRSDAARPRRRAYPRSRSRRCSQSSRARSAETAAS